MQGIRKLLLSAGIPLAAAGGLVALAGTAAAVTPLNVTLSASGTGASAVWSPAGNPVLTIGAPAATTYAQIKVNSPPSAIPADAPTFATDNYKAGSPRWYIQFADGDYLFGYPSNAGLGSGNWEVMPATTGACHTMTGTTKYYTYTAAVAFIQNAGCGGNVTGVDIIADGDQAAGTSDTITGITYGSETVVSGPVTTYAGTIRLHKPGLCLDDRLNSRTPSAAVQVWRCNGLASQQWQVMSDGTIRHNGLCLDARASGTANGVRIQLWSCTGAANQQWDTRGWRVHYDNPAASRKVLDDSASGGPGTQQEIYTNTGGANQVWATS